MRFTRTEKVIFIFLVTLLVAATVNLIAKAYILFF